MENKDNMIQFEEYRDNKFTKVISPLLEEVLINSSNNPDYNPFIAANIVLALEVESQKRGIETEKDRFSFAFDKISKALCLINPGLAKEFVKSAQDEDISDQKEGSDTETGVVDSEIAEYIEAIQDQIEVISTNEYLQRTGTSFEMLVPTNTTTTRGERPARARYSSFFKRLKRTSSIPEIPEEDPNSLSERNRNKILTSYKDRRRMDIIGAALIAFTIGCLPGYRIYEGTVAQRSTAITASIQNISDPFIHQDKVEVNQITYDDLRNYLAQGKKGVNLYFSKEEGTLPGGSKLHLNEEVSRDIYIEAQYRAENSIRLRKNDISQQDIQNETVQIVNEIVDGIVNDINNDNSLDNSTKQQYIALVKSYLRLYL